MATTRRIYRDVATMIYNLSQADVNNVQESAAYVEGYMSALFELDNSRFDTERFAKWCREGTDKR